MNSQSSRSHFLMGIEIKQENIVTKSTKTSLLQLVDLAGSEKVSRSQVTGSALQEASSINKTLSALSHVIKQLSKKQKPNFRNSVLTKVLQNSFGGNSLTSILIACSLDKLDYNETVSSLRFGVCAKGVQNKIKINSIESPQELKRMIASLKDTISDLTNKQMSPLSVLSDTKNSNEYSKLLNQFQRLKDKIIVIKQTLPSIILKQFEDKTGFELEETFEADLIEKCESKIDTILLEEENNTGDKFIYNLDTTIASFNLDTSINSDILSFGKTVSDDIAYENGINGPVNSNFLESSEIKMKKNQKQDIILSNSKNLEVQLLQNMEVGYLDYDMKADFDFQKASLTLEIKELNSINDRQKEKIEGLEKSISQIEENFQDEIKLLEAQLEEQTLNHMIETPAKITGFISHSPLSITQDSIKSSEQDHQIINLNHIIDFLKADIETKKKLNQSLLGLLNRQKKQKSDLERSYYKYREFHKTKIKFNDKTNLHLRNRIRELKSQYNNNVWVSQLYDKVQNIQKLVHKPKPPFQQRLKGQNTVFFDSNSFALQTSSTFKKSGGIAIKGIRGGHSSSIKLDPEDRLTHNN